MKVLIIGEFREASKKRIRDIFPADWQLAIVASEELNDQLDEAEVIIPEHVNIDAAFLKRAKHLKLVQTGAGFDNVDIEACTTNGVYVANAAGVNAVAVAEHIFALVLSWYKNILILDRKLKRGEYSFDYSGAELSGKVIGIIGLGNIGRQVAAYARAFKMRVLGYDVHPVDLEDSVELVDFENLLEKSDVITLNTFLNAHTHHLISRQELELMRPDAILVNTSRGPVVDESALIEALRSKKIGGACLDVFETEPLPEASPLRKLNNVILTPHTAGMPDGLKFHKKRYEYFIENINRVSRGRPPMNALNRIG
ncbi:D-3-phosphoglycerate dehydrogenase (EC [Olavius algarvensis Delta 1 endosymbiont]|nr:D-3-phosphoglycerate dehydrogenase (EC [Olavius algarvensis Delta 1 endosymbiont]